MEKTELESEPTNQELKKVDLPAGLMAKYRKLRWLKAANGEIYRAYPNLMSIEVGRDGFTRIEDEKGNLVDQFYLGPEIYEEIDKLAKAIAPDQKVRVQRILDIL